MLPSLYPIVAVAGAGARRLLDRQAEAEETLADQERTLAVQAERERLARDMHDSLAKTVHGIGFAALALSRRIEVDPPGAVEDARKLAADARTAAQEARELLERAARPRRLRAAAADRDPLGGGALGRADRARGSAGRSTTSGRCRRSSCASCAGSSRRRWPTSSATRTPPASTSTCAGSATASC